VPVPTFIVVGPPRSGTTLLANLLATCYDLHYPWFEGLPGEGNRIVPTLPLGRTGYVYKRPELADHSPSLVRLRETWVQDHARFMGIIRDPRALATSTMHGQTYYGVGNPGQRLELRWPRMARTLIQAFEFALPPWQRIVIRYEDLLLRTEEVEQEITRWIELPLRQPFASAHTHMVPPDGVAVTSGLKGVRPLDPSRATARGPLELTPDVCEMLDAWGYELP
jgi:hypothetical protein